MNEDTAIRRCINWSRSSDNLYRRNSADEAAAQLSDLLVQNDAQEAEIKMLHMARETDHATIAALRAQVAELREALKETQRLLEVIRLGSEEDGWSKTATAHINDVASRAAALLERK